MANTGSAASRSHGYISTMVRVAVLIAVILVLNYTPLGFLRLGPVEITFLQIPVIIGAVLMGPGVGTILGVAFGLVSLSQAPASPIFAPVLTSLPRWLMIGAVCVIPRAAMGFLSGVIARVIRNFAKTRPTVTYAVTGVIGSLLNTVLFISGVIVVLNDYIVDTMYELGLLAEKTLAIFWIGIGVTNGLPEAAATGLLVAVICKALSVAFRDRSVKP